MVNEPEAARPSTRWSVTPVRRGDRRGGPFYCALLGSLVKQDIRDGIQADETRIRTIANEMNSFSDELRCRDDVVWRLTSEHALEAEVQLQLAIEGFRSQPVDEGILSRLERAKTYESKAAQATSSKL